MAKLEEILHFLEQIAPAALQEEWDNSGLQVGAGNGAVKRVLLALTPSLSVVREAVERKVQLLLVHHPMIFRPLKSIDTSKPEGGAIELALNHRLSIYSAHTNLDKAAKGTSWILAERLGLEQVRPLLPEGELLKLAVFVPQDHTQKVLSALAEAGAGHIGHYTHCSFRVAGMGTFLPLEGTNPFIGQQGRLEEVKEDRLEMIFPVYLQEAVLEAMKRVHPYEEVAYDLYPLVHANPITGLGAVGNLKQSVTIKELVDLVRQKLGCSWIKLAGKGPEKIQRVACLGGSGGKFVSVAIGAGVDAYITGEVSYHEAIEAQEKGLWVLDAGHYATERPVMESLQKDLASRFPHVEFLLSEQEGDPFDIA